MNQLLFCIAYTTDIQKMKRYYRDAIGLAVESEGRFFCQLGGAGGASLGLLAVAPGTAQGIELCFRSDDIEADVETLTKRGLTFVDEITRQEFGRLVHALDPEGNTVTLLEPGPDAPGGARAAGRGSRTARAGGEAAAGVAVAAVTGERPVLHAAIVNCHDMAATRAFYRDRLGLHPRTDSEWWVEFDSGPTRLALHPHADRPGVEQHHAQRITLALRVPDVVAWSEVARDRGVPFVSSPQDEGFGMMADAVDPEGNVIVMREPPPEPTLEESLAEAFEDDGAPRKAAIRKPVKKTSKAVSRVALRPDYHSRTARTRKTTTKPAAKSKLGVSKVRGSGPAGSRIEPKKRSDPKRARSRPAVGRLKKAERRTLSRKKGAVARSSKGKPVKRGAASKGRPAGRKTARRGRR